MYVEYLCVVVTDVTCTRAADVVLVIDQSTSIVLESSDNSSSSSSYWVVQMLGFAKRIAGSFTIGRNQTQIGLLKFSDDAEIVFHLNRYGDRQSLLNAIHSVPIGGGNTNIAVSYTHLTLPTKRIV